MIRPGRNCARKRISGLHKNKPRKLNGSKKSGNVKPLYAKPNLKSWTVKEQRNAKPNAKKSKKISRKKEKGSKTAGPENNPKTSC